MFVLLVVSLFVVLLDWCRFVVGVCALGLGC